MKILANPYILGILLVTIEIVSGMLLGSAIGIGIMMVVFWAAGHLGALTLNHSLDRPFKLKVTLSYMVPVVLISLAGMLTNPVFGNVTLVWLVLVVLVVLYGAITYIMLGAGSKTYEKAMLAQAKQISQPAVKP